MILIGEIEHKVFPEEYALNQYYLYEWKPYRLKIEPEEKTKYAKVFFGEEEAKKDPDYNFWEFTFKNYIGKSEIKIILGNRLLPPLPVEVLSSKLTLDERKPLFYPEFCRKLIQTLEQYQTSLTFEIHSPTFVVVEDIPVPPNLLVLYNQIITLKNDIVEGLQAILANPHKELITEEEYVTIDEVDSINSDTYISIILHPHLLVKSKDKSILSCKLKGHLPERVMQFGRFETFNTPENKFVKQFLRELTNYIAQIKQTYKLGMEKKEILNHLKNYLELALQTEVFQSVDESLIPPNFTSQVLMKKEGYREILQVRSKLLSSKAPVFTYLQEKISKRNVSDLYEFWCFFRLTEKLAEHFKAKPKVNIETTVEGRLAKSRVKSIIGDYHLVYNKNFLAGKESYSVSLRPDFTLQNSDDKNLIIFDAKFRLEIKEQELEKNGAEDAEEKALQKGDMERVACISDIFKMHTYKEALNAKSAIILYPGDKNIFYSKKDFKKIDGGFNEIFQKICHFEEGTGCLSFVPN